MRNAFAFRLKTVRDRPYMSMGAMRNPWANYRMGPSPILCVPPNNLQTGRGLGESKSPLSNLSQLVGDQRKCQQNTFFRTHWLAVKCMPRTIVLLSPKPQISERRSMRSSNGLVTIVGGFVRGCTCNMFRGPLFLDTLCIFMIVWLIQWLLYGCWGRGARLTI